MKLILSSYLICVFINAVCVLCISDEEIEEVSEAHNHIFDVRKILKVSILSGWLLTSYLIYQVIDHEIKSFDD